MPLGLKIYEPQFSEGATRWMNMLKVGKGTRRKKRKWFPPWRWCGVVLGHPPGGATGLQGDFLHVYRSLSPGFITVLGDKLWFPRGCWSSGRCARLVLNELQIPRTSRGNGCLARAFSPMNRPGLTSTLVWNQILVPDFPVYNPSNALGWLDSSAIDFFLIFDFYSSLSFVWLS